MTTTRTSTTVMDRYAAVVGALHSIDQANRVRRRRERAEVFSLLLTIGVLVVAIVL